MVDRRCYSMNRCSNIRLVESITLRTSRHDVKSSVYTSRSSPTTLSPKMGTYQSPEVEKNEEPQPHAKISMVGKEKHKMCTYSLASLLPHRTIRPASMISFQVASEKSRQSDTLTLTLTTETVPLDTTDGKGSSAAH